MYIDTTN